MGVESCTVYIKGDQNVEVKSHKVTLGDALEIECVNQHALARIKSLCLMQLPEKGEQRSVVSILKVIEKIHETYPNAEVVNLGAPDMIITFEKEKKTGKTVEIIKVVLVSLITFVGSAFSIMTFNNDVDVTKLFAQIYEQFTGEAKTGFTVLEVTYSFGIALGILVFFNHFGKKKFSVDPTPIEVEMRTYENEIQTTLIQNFEREGKALDLDQTRNLRNHRP